ncbi:ribonuclease R [Thermonema rossianum]|uniref:ribonuclease R n=1 Tax=Thermonema rossianum TaxID=55505 RepID=UPI001FE09769|nr:ribonuclease R [Thermonema rossianum]
MTMTRKKKKIKAKLVTKRKRKNKATVDIKQLKEQILKVMEEPLKHGYSIRTIMRKLHAEGKKSKRAVMQAVEELLDEGHLYFTSDGRMRSALERQNVLVGVVDQSSPYYAFVVPKDPALPDVWVSVEDLNTAFDGDVVKVAYFDSEKGLNPEGKVLEILERKHNRIVGRLTIDRSGEFGFVEPDSRRYYMDIFVPKESLHGAQTDDKVIVEIVKWPKNGKKPVGKVVSILGKAGDHNTEMHAIMAEYNLPYEFPKRVEQAAEKISAKIPKAEIARRRDFRGIPTFTIDPEDAKDFDDALSIRKLENGNWEVGVHIADVTYYVKPGSVLDKEAFQRATSVYLVDRVVPMLPERLSNDLCSLRPHEDRLTFSAVFEVDKNARVLNSWFGRTIIHSQRRFTYEEAQERIETGKGDFAGKIRTLNRLAKILRKRRFEHGAISFETVEVRFRLAQDGTPLEVVPKIRKDAHKMIEEWMLLANRKVAEFVYNLKKKEPRLTMVYRVHEPPVEDRLETFAKFIAKFGYKLDTSDPRRLAQSYNALTEAVEGKPEQNFIESLAIRTMSKARYTTEPLGHFGLAFDHYTHFTSPIRRYPDMMVHRLLWHYLHKGQSVNKEEYESYCEHASEMERRAEEAERASIKYKQVEFMQNRTDEVFDGIVTGVTEHGVYVEIVQTKCEGRVAMSDLQGDYYELDHENYRLVGRKTKRIIAFGDKVKVKVKATSLAARTIDLLLVE